jgi:hypothetical protein
MAFPPVNEPINKLRGYKPLVYLGDKIILARLNEVYVADLRLEQIRHVCTVGKLSGIPCYLSRFRLMQRLLRLEMGPATPLEEDGCFLVFYRNKVFHVDIERRVAKPEVVPALTKKPLQMLLIQSGVHKGSVLLGDYQLNAEYGPVNIYRRDRTGVWNVSFVFPKGEINHVHGILEDARSECFYILTGDFGKGACIWKADTSLKDVRPLVRSGQMSRACWLMPWNGKLIFATDQQANFNYLCTIEVGESVRVNRQFPIAGSSIYFSNTHSDPIVFSTAVEPKSTNGVTPGSLMSTRRAAGILSDEACVYVGTPALGFEILFSGKKDGLPFGLFQFGNINFPSGTSSDQSYVHFYCSALTGHDGTTYVMKLKPND